jgi:hypothetical protein
MTEPTYQDRNVTELFTARREGDQRLFPALLRDR